VMCQQQTSEGGLVACRGVLDELLLGHPTVPRGLCLFRRVRPVGAAFPRAASGGDYNRVYSGQGEIRRFFSESAFVAGGFVPLVLGDLTHSGGDSESGKPAVVSVFSRKCVGTAHHEAHFKKGELKCVRFH
jgi:hypothetical protein